jgi:SAM-dependent methyltransferase
MRLDTEIDPRRLKVHRKPARRDVPYVPTDDAVVAALLRFAQITERDHVYDLGCGDGRIVIAAAKRFGAQGLGVDIDPVRIEEARENAKRAGVMDKVRFVLGSFFDIDLRPASVVTLYLLPGINAQLRPKLQSELQPGSRVLSNHFPIGDWPPDQVSEAHHRKLQKWLIPARVEGRWNCVVHDRDGRRRVILHLERTHQVITGRATVAGRDTPIGDGRIVGTHLSFRLVEWGRGGKVMRYEGEVEGSSVRGRCWEELHEAEPGEWAATKVSHNLAARSAKVAGSVAR